MAYILLMGCIESYQQIILLLLLAMALIIGANILFLRYARHLTSSGNLPDNQGLDDATLRSYAQDMNEYEMICIKYGEKRLAEIVLQRLRDKGLVKSITVEER